MSLDSHLVASTWLAAFASACQSGDVDAFGSLFLSNGWLRDLLVFTWDMRSLEGRDKVSGYVATTLANAQIKDVKLDETEHLAAQTAFLPLIHAMDVELAFTFECRNGHGRAFARLLPDKDNSFRALTVFLMLSDLRGHEEQDVLTLRDDSGAPGRDMQQDFQDWVHEVETKPHVLIIGAGQNGVQVAARFKAMQIPTLVIEQHARVGDVWRKRYPTLALHTIKRMNTLLYQSFPSNWPEFTPRDKLADWLEHYVSIQDLVVWTSSKLHPSPVYDSKTGTWDVTINRKGQDIRLRPSHIIFATGTLGAPYIPDIPGKESFRGQVLHSEGFGGAAEYAGKRVVVVGAGNSSIDICQDLVLQGAQEVTMIQRSPSCVVSRDFVKSQSKLRYRDEWSMDVADMRSASLPIALFRQWMIANEGAMWAAQKELHDKLRKGGVQLNMGPEGQGLFILVLERLGGYWQDKGAADLVADGRIKVKSGVAPTMFTKTGLIFNDGSKLDVDVVVLATGYVPIREANRALLGEEVMSQTKDIYGLDSEGEIKGSYRPSGHPGLWFATGDFFASRFYSKTLALQIKAKQLGLL
ncbi:FAD/NAD-P-binding domain-containing protein [Lenzites betulinus]|nr:FAD/NAD-P-binding domain-containing protein [Lenzites betulinus]